MYKNITDDTALDFCRNYLVQTDEEFEVLKKHQSRRTIDSSNKELDALYEIYIREKENIKPVFDIVLAGDNDEIFPLETQQEFFKDKLCIVKNARHNIFYRLKNYEDVFRLAFN
ncbi:DUF452 family protein [bacterium]|nr:DUF452 family protein [bacterium]